MTDLEHHPEGAGSGHCGELIVLQIKPTGKCKNNGGDLTQNAPWLISLPTAVFKRRCPWTRSATWPSSPDGCCWRYSSLRCR